MNLLNLLLATAAIGITAAAQAAPVEENIPLVTCGTPNDRITFTSNFPAPEAWKRSASLQSSSDEEPHNLPIELHLGANYILHELVFWRDVDGERQVYHARNSNGNF